MNTEKFIPGSGKIDIVFIGSGDGKGGGLKYGDTNIIVKKDNINVLIDFGTTNANAFPVVIGTTHNIGVSNINAILPTNLEPDHIGGIVNFLLDRVNPSPPIDLLLPNDSFKNQFEQSILPLLQDYDPAATFTQFFNPIIINATSNVYSDIRLQYFAQGNNYGLVIDERIYFSGDTIDTNKIISEGTKPEMEYLFQKCDFSEHNTIEYDNLLAALQNEQPIRDKMYLMHYNRGATINQNEFKGLAQGLTAYVVLED